MSYKLEKPYKDKQRADFIVKHNHNNGLVIAETVSALYALEFDEIMQDGVPVKNPDFESEQLSKAKEVKVQEINTAKELAFKDGVYFNNVHYDCDDRAQDRTGNRLVLLQAVPVETLEWLDYKYISHTLTAAEFQQLCGLIFERIQFIEFKTGEYLNAIEEAVSIEELQAMEIDFTGETENE